MASRNNQFPEISDNTSKSFNSVLMTLYSAFFGIAIYYGAVQSSLLLDSIKPNFSISGFFGEAGLKLFVLFLISAFALEDFIGLTVANSSYRYKYYISRFVCDIYIVGVAISSVILLYYNHRSFILLVSFIHFLATFWIITLQKEFKRVRKYYFLKTRATHFAGGLIFLSLFMYCMLYRIEIGVSLYKLFIVVFLIWYLPAVTTQQMSGKSEEDLSRYQYMVIGKLIKQLLRLVGLLSKI